MPVRIAAGEQGADFVVRKRRNEYRIYPISDEALRWLKAHASTAAWAMMDGRKTVTARRADAARLLADMRSNEFQVRGDLDNQTSGR